MTNFKFTAYENVNPADIPPIYIRWTATINGLASPSAGCCFPMGGKTDWGFNINARYNYIIYKKTGLNNKEWNNLMFFDYSFGVMVFF